MRPFDYISVLLFFVISLALAHLLTGIAHMIQNGIRRFSIPLVQWIGFCLFLCVDYWFSVWHAHAELVWSLPYVGLLLTQASLVFIASRLIVPGPDGERLIDLTAFYDRNRRKFMGTVLILGIVNEGP